MGDFYEKPHFTMAIFKVWGPGLWDDNFGIKGTPLRKIWPNKLFCISANSSD